MFRSTSACLYFLGLKPSVWLAALGGGLEILGFTLVAVELLRAQRRELGTAGPFQFLVNAAGWIRLQYRRLFGKTITHEASAISGASTAGSGRASVRLGTESKDPEERLRVLEENFKHLDAEITQHRTELDQRIDKESETQQAAVNELKNDLQKRDEAERAAFRTSAALQWSGIGLFVLGAAASAAANIVTCA